MKKLHTVALTMTLLFGLGANAPVTASAGAHSTSHSFKSGFSSQRSSSARPSPPAPSGSRSQFGGFGGSRPAAPPPAAGRDQSSSNSVLNRELDRQASQDRALRTLDARRAPLPVAAPAPVQNQAGMPMPMPMPVPMQPPVVIQQRSGAGDMLTGILVGRALSDNHSTGYPGGQAARADPGGDGDPVRSQGSFPGRVLRLFMWLAVLAAIGWSIYYAVRSITRSRQERAPNYTFERK